ncbi:MAG: triose-phosphate isomerase family protein [Malacoplasma sp.]
MKNKILVANWKLNADYFSIKKFMSNLNSVDNVDIYLVPTYLGLLPTMNLLGNVNSISVAAQNVNNVILGDHTGSISWVELKDYGITTVVLGHHETMKDFHDNFLDINTKVRTLLENEFKVILCISETRVDLLKESTKEALKVQMKQLLANIDPFLFKDRLILVYQPTFISELSERVTPKFVIETVKVIRNFLREEYNYYIGNIIPILYGGDYLSDDIVEIIKSDYIDGIMLDDSRAISAKYVSLILKVLYKSNTDSYKTFYDQNLIVTEPLELEREKSKDLFEKFDEYDIDNDSYFKEIDLEDEDI